MNQAISSTRPLVAPKQRTTERDLPFRLVVVASLGICVWAWDLRAEPLWRASSGFGYALGIAGLAMMSLLMAYPLRKRFLSPEKWGPTRTWFRVHMVLGVLGPVAILLHANFRLGSLNSSAALLSMAVVAGSGFVGRMLYTRIHLGLSAQRDTLASCKVRLDDAHERLMDASPGLAIGLQDLHDWAGGVSSLRRSLHLVLGAPALVRLRMHAAVVRDDPELSRMTLDYIRILRRVAWFRLSERLFATWHTFHLPLAIILFVAAGAHVVAVHMY